jgi:hypothetical protein
MCKASNNTTKRKDICKHGKLLPPDTPVLHGDDLCRLHGALRISDEERHGYLD